VLQQRSSSEGGMKALRETIAAFGVLFAFATVTMHYAELPNRIPTHFNAHGMVNGWGDKSSLWHLVGVTCALYLMLTLLRFLPPSLINLPVGPDRRAAAMPIAMATIGWIKAEIAWTFALSIWTIVALAQGRIEAMSAWFLPATLIVIFGTIAYYLVRTMGLPGPTTDQQDG
jgi:uncharacterized membrane protein